MDLGEVSVMVNTLKRYNNISRSVADKMKQNLNLDFTDLQNPDILESFDFDSFLNTDDAQFAFDPNLPYSGDGVETGTGDGM